MSLKTSLRRIRRRTWIIIGSAAVLVAAGTVTGVLLLTPRAEAQAQTITQTATASLETMEKSVSASGTLTPVVQETAAFSVSGRVTSILVEAGDVVEAGDALATVDTLQLNADLLDAKATLAEAKATLASAQSSSTGSSADLARISAASAAVDVAAESVSDAQAAVGDATLVATVAGLVTSVGYEVGDSVGSGGGAGGTGSTTTSGGFTIVGTDAWEVSVTLGEADVVLVAAGNQVELATSAGTALFGVVREVGKLPSTSSGTPAYPVTIDITGTADGLYDGVSVTATVIYERRTDVLTVPSAAITTTDGVSTVTVQAEDGTETEATVEIGETDGTNTEILSGLSEGDVVVVATFTPGEGNSGTGGMGGTFPGGGMGGNG